MENEYLHVIDLEELVLKKSVSFSIKDNEVKYKL